MQEKKDKDTETYVTDLMKDHKYYDVVPVIEDALKDTKCITETGQLLLDVKTKVRDHLTTLEEKGRKFLEDIKNGPREIQNMIVEIEDYLKHKVYTVVHDDIKSYRKELVAV